MRKIIEDLGNGKELVTLFDARGVVATYERLNTKTIELNKDKELEAINKEYIKAIAISKSKVVKTKRQIDNILGNIIISKEREDGTIIVYNYARQKDTGKYSLSSIKVKDEYRYNELYFSVNKGGLLFVKSTDLIKLKKYQDAENKKRLKKNFSKMYGLVDEALEPVEVVTKDRLIELAQF